MRDHDDHPYVIIERSSGGVGSFLGGVLVGAAIALLLAPRSGRETRQEIREGVQRARNTAEDRLRQVQERVTAAVEDVRRQVNERVDAARDAIEAGRTAARNTRAELEQRIHEARVGLRSAVDVVREPPADAQRESAASPDA